MPKAVKAIKVLLWLKIIFSTLFVVYVIYLAFAQPVGGWSGFNLGFLEGLTGQKGPIYFSSEDAGRASAMPLISILITSGMLLFFKKKKLKYLRGLVIFSIILFFGKGSPLFDIIILVLSFTSSVKTYFKPLAQ